MHYPVSVGIDFYGDHLFTRAAEREQHPERLRRFREASLKGWRYTMDHPQQMKQHP